MLIVGSAALLEKDDAAKQWVRKRNADFIRADAPTGEFLARMEAVISRVESLRAPTRRPFARRVGALDIPPSSAPDGEEDSQKTPFHGEHAGAASNLWSDELRQRLFAHIVPELRSNRSQRLDARQVTDFFGLTLADVARVLGRPPSSVHRTPDAPSLQEGLEIFERMASALLKLAGSWELARLWLNARNAALDMAPIDAIRQGHGRVVIGLLEDALMGMPT
jgi:hypothetical protein